MMADIDQSRFEALMGKALTDIGGAMAGLMAYMGDRLGLYRVLDENGPGTSAEIAAKAGLDERYVREWLSAVAAAGYVDYEAAGETFSLSPEAAPLFAAQG